MGLLRETDRPIIGVVDADGDTICLIDSEGKLLPLDEAKNALGRRLGEKDKLRGKELPPDLQLRETQRTQFRASMHKLASGVDDEQEIAYAAAKGFDGKQHLRELIVTPVLEKTKNEKTPVGAIIVSVLTSDLGERALHSFSQATDVTPSPESTGKKHRDADEGISSGFWLEGKLHSETIPVSMRDEVGEAVQKKLEQGKVGSDFRELTLDLAINGEAVPHKVLYRVLNPDSPFPPACQVAIYSLKAEVAEERAMMKQIGSVGALALAIALLAILFLSRGLTKPIHDLVKATELIRQGDYDVVVPVQSKDEVGQLATSFNEMAEGLRLNQKYQRLLSQVTDRMVAEQLINSSEAALGGELREVSVLFCDIRGFTTLTAGMPPHDVISLLNEHMTALTSLVHQDSGVVDKFVGDMVMALFGAPFAYGDDAFRAAQCALRMVEIRDQLNRSGRWQFQVGIGLATGTVVAGCMGSSERLDYTVLGDRVNLASRLCSSAGEGCILIDDTTRELLGDAAEVEVLEGLALKGFPEGVTAYRLIGLNQAKAEAAATTVEA
jgi:class 3 adenylate cyclase